MLIEIPLEDDCFLNPHYKHVRSWVAVVSGRNVANVDRVFLNRGGDGLRYIDTTLLFRGDALEFCSDHQVGYRPVYERHHYLVSFKSLSQIGLMKLPTLAKVLKASREYEQQLLPCPR